MTWRTSTGPARETLDVEGPALEGWRRAAAVAAVLSAMVLVVLSAAVVNVALPTLARAFDVPPALAVRVVGAHQLGLVMALLPAAALGERLGYRAVFTGGVALFTTASLGCAFAPSLDWLVVARFVQGLGGAAVMALGVALMRFAVPRDQLAAAIGWNALAVALASAAGPALGSILVAQASWPSLFVAPLPLGVAVLLATRALPQVPGTARRLDPSSMALSATAFGALTLGVERLASEPIGGLGLIALAVASGAALLRRERLEEAPLVPLDLLRRASFRVSVIASMMCFTGQTAALVALPFHLQGGFAQEPLAVGMLITPWPLSVAVVAPVAGRLADRLPSAWLCAAGGGLLALGLAALALWPLAGGVLAMVPFVALSGIGFGLFQVPNNRNLFLAAPRDRSAAAGGMQGTARLAGQTAGAVLMTVLFALAPLALAPRLGLAIGAVLTLGAGVVSIMRGGAPSGLPEIAEVRG